MDEASKLFHDLESNDTVKNKEAKEKLASILSSEKDAAITANLMDYFCVSNSSRIVDVLIKAQPPHDKFIMEKLSQWIRSTNNKSDAVHIFGEIVKKNPTWLYKVVDHHFMKDILKFIKTEDSISLMLRALLCIIFLLPITPSPLAKMLPEIFDAFFYTASRHLEKSDMGQKFNVQFGLMTFFERLYGMYPCNFMAYIKDVIVKENPDVFTNVVSPMLRSVRLHPMLLTSNAEIETTAGYWLKRDPADIVVECSRYSLEERRNINNSDQRLSTSSYDHHQIPNISAIHSKYPIFNLSSPYNLSTASNNNSDILWSPSLAVATPPPQSVLNQLSYSTQSGTLGVSPPEAAVEATPETTPLKEYHQLGKSNFLAGRSVARAILTNETIASPSMDNFSNQQKPQQEGDTSIRSSKLKILVRDRSLSDINLGNTSSSTNRSVEGSSTGGKSQNQSDSESRRNVSYNKTADMVQNLMKGVHEKMEHLSDKSGPSTIYEDLLLERKNLTRESEESLLDRYIASVRTKGSTDNKNMDDFWLIVEYERSRRKMYAQRIRRLLGYSRGYAELKMEKVKLSDQVEQLSKEHSEMSLLLKRNRKEQTVKDAEYTKKIDQLNKENNRLKLDNKTLTETVNTLNKDYKQLSDSMADVANSLQFSHGELFDLRNDLLKAISQAELGSYYKDELSKLKFKVIVMGEIHQRCKEQLSQVYNLKATESENDAIRRSYEEEVRELRNQSRVQSSHLEAAKYRLTELEQQISQRDADLLTQKRLFKICKEEYDEKLRASDDKYKIQKDIILRLEESVFQNKENKQTVRPDTALTGSLDPTSPLSISLASSDGLSVSLTSVKNLQAFMQNKDQNTTLTANGSSESD